MSAPPQRRGAAEDPGEGGSAATGAELSALRRYRAAARQRRASGNDLRRGTMRRSTIVRTGSGPDARDPQPLVAVLRRLTDERGWTTDMAVWALSNRWAEIVGPQVAVHVVVERFEPEPPDDPGSEPEGSRGGAGRGTRSPAAGPQQQALLGGAAPQPAPTGGLLTLRADSPAWREQIVWNLAALQRRLDEELGHGVVGRIVVLGPEPPRRAYGRRRVTR